MDDALKFLAQRLKDAQRHQPPEDDPDTNLRRHRAMEALSAVVTYLRDAGVGLEAYAPLLELLGALGDASCGRSNELLTPTPYEGGPKKPINNRWRMVTAAAAVTIWRHDAKWKPKDAIREAAEAIGTTEDELRDFRKKLNRARGSKSRAPQADIDHDWWCVNLARQNADRLPPDMLGRLLLTVPEKV